jgi:hypothetical protein
MPFTSQLREAVDDTLLRKAEGTAFDRLAARYGYPRPHYIERWAWRRACLAAVFGRAGTFPVLHAFLEGAMAQYATRFDATLNGSAPTRVLAPSGTFGTHCVTRLVRIPGLGLFRIASRSSSQEVELLRFATSYWDAADWSALDGEVTIQGAEILAFEVHEPTPAAPAAGESVEAGEPSVVRVMVHGGVLSPVPPTYLQEDAGARPIGQPLGGSIQADASEHGDQVQGPFPIYLVGQTVLREVATIASRMLVPAGFRVEFRRALSA